VPVLFYRAALEGAGSATLEALYEEVERRGMYPVPLMISTLKEAACVRFVKAAFAANRPQAILNLTGFALGLDGLEDKLNPFAETDAPVIQLVQGGRPEAQWAADSQGLSAKDLAMQVVLPELDGRIGGIIVGHKAEAVWHARTECPLSAYAPDLDGGRRVVPRVGRGVRARGVGGRIAAEDGREADRRDARLRVGGAGGDVERAARAGARVVEERRPGDDHQW